MISRSKPIVIAMAATIMGIVSPRTNGSERSGLRWGCGGSSCSPAVEKIAPMTSLPKKRSIDDMTDSVRHPQLPPIGGIPKMRDIRLDFFRGLALWFIFLDHIPGNTASWLTLRNYGFSDATEIFVFISGYTAALAYGGVMRGAGLLQSSARIIKRAWQIYCAHIFSFVIYAATIGYVAGVTHNSSYIDEFGLADFFAKPSVMFSQVVLLRFKPANMDVLPMYVVLLMAFPPVLWLLIRKPGVALFLSVALYVLARYNGWHPSSYTGDAWVFNPFAWQLLFMFGAWCALGGAQRLSGIFRSRMATIVAAGYLVFAFALAMTWHQPTLAEFVPNWLSSAIYPINKPNLDVLRIIHFLALSLLTVRLVGRDSSILKSPLLHPVLRCGKHSLQIFCAGVLLSFIAYAMLVRTSGGIATQILVSASGISQLVALSELMGWYQSFDGRRSLQSADEETLINRLKHVDRNVMGTPALVRPN
jgi:hypothetical protein